MKSKIGEKIFSETSEETKQKAIYYANNLVPKNIKLISMTDFVLTHDRLFILDSDLKFSDRKIIKEKRITNYAKFLKQPLKLEMFVPCDEDGNPFNYKEILGQVMEGTNSWSEYKQAEERVLFKGIDLDTAKFHCNRNDRTIEYFTSFEVELTPNAIKHLFG